MKVAALVMTGLLIAAGMLGGWALSVATARMEKCVQEVMKDRAGLATWEATTVCLARGREVSVTPQKVQAL